MPLVCARKMRRANFLIERSQFVLRFSDMGVPFDVLDDRAVTCELAVDQAKDEICDVQRLMAAEAFRPVTKFRRLLFAALLITLPQLGKPGKTFRF